MADHALERMRCVACRRPWGRGPDAPRACPFCGSACTIAAGDVLSVALPPGPRGAQRAWLFGKEARHG